MWTNASSFIRRAPALLYGRRLVVGTFALLWATGGAMVAFELLAFADEHRGDDVLWSVALTALLVGLLSWVFRGRMTTGALVAGTFLGVAVITVTVLFGGSPELSMAFGLMNVWAVLFGFLFFPRPVALTIAGFAVVCHVVVAIALPSLSGTAPLMFAVTFALLGVVVDRLHRTRATAEMDVLTGAANSVGFMRFLEREIAADAPGTLTLGILELDGYDRWRVRHGQEVADRFLVDLTTEWRSHLRDVDLLARLGDARFAVVLMGPEEEAAAAVDRLRRMVPGPVTCSAGVVSCRTDEVAAVLVQRADMALATATRRGGNSCVVGCDDAPTARELARAIERGELALMAQPVVHARTGHLSGFEVLVRWDHPERGRISPAEFIPIAEQTGLIVPLGLWVLDEACRHGGAWLRRFPDQHLNVAVNVSGRQLNETGFVDAVVDALRRHGLPAHRLTLELTESVLASDLDAWKQRLHELARIGVHLSMDDFGTGYSSLSQLRELPFRSIKIDRSFVSDLPDSREATALVSAVVGMAAGLDRQIVAEGVETVEQLADLIRHGCDEVQGYLLGRPEPIEGAAVLIRQQHRVHALVRAAASVPGPPEVEEVTFPASFEEGADDLEQVVRPLLERLTTVAGAESAYLTHVDWDRLVQRVLVSENTGSLHVAEGIVVAWDDTVCRRALEGGIACTHDARAQFPDSAAAQDLAIGTYATAPVVLPDGTVYGTLCVASSRREPVGDELSSLLTCYSRLIGEALARHLGVLA